MALTPEEYSKKAAFYEKVTEDASASREQRTLFAKKANWLRILARIAEKQEEAASRSFHREAVPEGMRPLQARRWKIGRSLTAVVCTLAERLKGRERQRGVA
jgi:hypothetical protein